TEAGVPSLIFVITDMIGKPGYLNAEEIRSLASEGFGIGLHGKRHYEVTKILAEGGNLTDELVQARQVLQQVSGKQVTWYAYPFGEYSDAAKLAVASAGLSLAFTIDALEHKRDQDPFKLPRLMYLKGAKEAGEPTVDDWLPPPNIKAGYLHLAMAALVLFFGIQILVRSLRFALYLRQLKLADSSSSTPPTVQGTPT
ncbi:MAG TPA: polysaccharide deacetylase family protein, partial [Candidatus Ozemobacteraceae bacterium]|nr:polysaccharide deacetylase family protein [Candidatus Ozemobacteraceae bacterium]